MNLKVVIVCVLLATFANIQPSESKWWKKAWETAKKAYHSPLGQKVVELGKEALKKWLGKDARKAITELRDIKQESESDYEKAMEMILANIAAEDGHLQAARVGAVLDGIIEFDEGEFRDAMNDIEENDMLHNMFIE